MIESHQKSTKLLNQDLEYQDNEANQFFPKFKEVRIGKPIMERVMSMTQGAGFKTFNRANLKRLKSKPLLLNEPIDERCQSCSKQQPKHHQLCTCPNTRKIITTLNCYEDVIKTKSNVTLQEMKLVDRDVQNKSMNNTYQRFLNGHQVRKSDFGNRRSTFNKKSSIASQKDKGLSPIRLTPEEKQA